MRLFLIGIAFTLIGLSVLKILDTYMFVIPERDLIYKNIRRIEKEMELITCRLTRWSYSDTTSPPWQV